MNYEYSSTHILLPEVLSKKIINWSNDRINNQDLSNHHGREYDPHVTILYGIHTKNPQKIIDLSKNIKPFTIELGKISIFTTNDLFDVIKIEVKSEELYKINKKFKYHLTHTQLFKEYKPHVTIAYVKKGKCTNLDNNKKFVGLGWKATEIVFSSSDGKKTNVSLKMPQVA